MKTIIVILFYFVYVSTLIYAQSELKWRLLTSAPYTNTLRQIDLSFINPSSGWVISGYRENGQSFNNVYKTQDGGRTWITITDTNFRGLRSVGFADSLNGWLGTLQWPGTVMYRTSNGGLNWIKVIDNLITDSLGICGLSVVDKNIVYGCGRYFGPAYFYKTTNGGINWTIKDMRNHITTLIDCHFFNKDSGFVVGGIGSSFSNRSGAILFTSDGGETWVNRITTPPRGQWCWKISFSDRNNGVASLERENPPGYFLKTTDGGQSWTEKLFSNVYGDEEGIGFINQNTGWIGGWNFYNYKTTDGGETWNEDPWGYNLNRIRILSDTLAYAVGKGVYKFSRDSIVGIHQVSSIIPYKFSLHQNYPNPFNPVTKINYELPITNYVTLKIYDALGKEVATLVNQKLSPGSYEVEFDGSNFSSGIYFYHIVIHSDKLQTNRFNEVKRMILLK